MGYESSANLILKPAIERRLLKGAVVGILKDGAEEVFSVGSEIPVDGLSELGSVTKVFTGLLLSTLVAQNRISLEDSVCKYLPSWVCHSPLLNPIRLLDLATHTSGLPLLPPSVTRMRRRVDDPYAGYRLDDLYRYLSRTSLERAAVAAYQYSNLGYTVLAQAMVNATGTEFPQLITQEILQPAGMHDTFVEVSDEGGKKLLSGHTPFGLPAVHWRSVVFAGCGGICSTAADCLRFLRFCIDPPSNFASALQSSLIPRIASGKPGETSHLSLGWKINDLNGWYWHNGVTGGHSAYLAFHPEKRLGIVVLTNRYTVKVIDQFAQHMQKVLEGGPAEPVTESFPWVHATVMQAKIEFVHMPFWARSGPAAAIAGTALWEILKGLHP